MHAIKARKKLMACYLLLAVAGVGAHESTELSAVEVRARAEKLDGIAAAGSEGVVSSHRLAALPILRPGEALSRRETEVLRLFASGLTVSEIARRLSRSVKTISRQKMDAMAKLGLHSDLEVYAYAHRHGLLP